MTAMTGANGRHARFRELAATALDFPLSRAEAAELEAHVAGCPACARLVAGLRFDATALRRPAELATSYRLDTAIGAAIAGRPARKSPQQTLLLVAATVLLLVAVLGVAAVGAFLVRTLKPPLVVVPSPSAPVVIVNPTPAPSGEPVPAVPALTWQLGSIPPMVEGGDLLPAAIGGGDGGFVAVGGRLFVDNEAPSGATASAWHSEDGRAWTPATVGAGLALGSSTPMDDEPAPGIADVAWGPEGWVAVGIDIDGNGNRFGAAWHSPNGATWSRLAFPDASRVRPAAVTWSGSQYVIVGTVRAEDAPRAAAWLSADGRSWERVPDGDAFDVGGYIQYYSASGAGGIADVTVAADGSLVAVGHACEGTTSPEVQATCRPIVLRSTDGESWQRVPGPDIERVGLASVAANGSRFVAIPGGPGALQLVQAPGQVVPQDGTTQVAIGDETGWRLVDLPGVPPLDRVVALGGWFVAVSSSDNRIRVWSSPDGEAWTEVPGVPQPPTSPDQDPEMQAFADVTLAAHGGRVVIVGRNQADPTGGSVFSIVGTAEAAEASPAPAPTASPAPEWQTSALPPMFDGNLAVPLAIAAGPARLAAVGGRTFEDADTPSRGTASAWHSDDGLAWEAATSGDDLRVGDAIPISGPQAGFADVAWGPGGFVAVGMALEPDVAGRAWHSSDGVTWTRVALPQPGVARPTAVTWSGRLYVAVGIVEAAAAPRAAVWLSPDGMTWRRVADGDAFDIGPYIDTMEYHGWGGPVDVTAGPDGILYAVGTRCAAARAGTAACVTRVWRSPDGESWSLVPEAVADSATASGLVSIAASRDGFVAVGPGSGLITDPNGLVLTGTADGWSMSELPAVPPLRRVVAFGDGYLALGATRTEISLLTSPDGSTWTPVAGVPQRVDISVLREMDLVVDRGRVVVVGWAELERDPGYDAFSIVWTPR